MKTKQKLFFVFSINLYQNTQLIREQIICVHLFLNLDCTCQKQAFVAIQHNAEIDKFDFYLWIDYIPPHGISVNFNSITKMFFGLMIAVDNKIWFSRVVLLFRLSFQFICTSWSTYDKMIMHLKKSNNALIKNKAIFIWSKQIICNVNYFSSN